jgi:hypothetical protein
LYRFSALIRLLRSNAITVGLLLVGAGAMAALRKLLQFAAVVQVESVPCVYCIAREAR